MALAESTAGRILVNKRELARRVLNTSIPTLDRLIDEYPAFPVERRGSNGVEWLFDVELVTEFLAARRAEEREAADAKQELFKQFNLPIDDALPDEAKGLSPAQRKQLAQARLVEQKLGVESGLLLHKPEVRQHVSSAAARLGRRLDGFPGQFGRAHGLPEPVVRAMRQQLDELRRAFVADLGDLGDLVE